MIKVKFKEKLFLENLKYNRMNIYYLIMHLKVQVYCLKIIKYD